ncbi:alpha/beta fold hydrolase [Alkalilimnicola sp. S0819]|uniref:alpha/beta fold hydrolase n=1 Tax=Alkalilimnicola sp. S0819 TaxID=2613922 RepID=UPI001261B385|nr:alpha/beta fold hydrolase [Alkalilimnicola sp. S0819]KAB7627294.1 alpha/beta hydrolase [Alkalilimnicola sp. S0819]MPQ16008.1 alpha/beta hydrolase [Alkalilimnicola sp. S0819]
MNAHKIYFAHGKESGPWGRKIQALAAVAEALGFAVESPDYSHTFDPRERVAQLLALAPGAPGKLVLVGSSMGGAVSIAASRTVQPDGLFLLAPAVYMEGYEALPEPRAGLIEVVHGWHDEVVPVDKALRFAREQRARLHLLDSGHTLQDAIPYLERLFRLFLEDVLAQADQP